MTAELKFYGRTGVNVKVIDTLRARFNFKVTCEVCKAFLVEFVILFSVQKHLKQISMRGRASQAGPL